MSHFDFEPADRRVHRALAGDSRVHTLDVLRKQRAPVAVGDLAKRVGLHPNTVRLQLEQLVEAGLVVQELEQRSQRGRPRLIYTAAPVASAERVPAGGRDGYQLLAEALTTQLEESSPAPAETATAAGRVWGRKLARSTRPPSGSDAAAATDYMVELLDTLGFDPQTADPEAETGQDIELHRCPFLETARRHAPVVCGVHLGLMQGALAELGAPVQATWLNPFVTPGICLTRLDPAETSSGARMPTFEHSTTTGCAP